jgi:hypothetical protein
MQKHCILCGKPFTAHSSWTRRCYPCSTALHKRVLDAGRAVRQAIARGDIPHPKHCKCVDCGAVAYGYDHRDYDRPLDVVPICRSCNAKRGPAKQALPGAQKAAA